MLKHKPNTFPVARFTAKLQQLVPGFKGEVTPPDPDVLEEPAFEGSALTKGQVADYFNSDGPPPA